MHLGLLEEAGEKTVTRELVRSFGKGYVRVSRAFRLTPAGRALADEYYAALQARKAAKGD